MVMGTVLFVALGIYGVSNSQQVPEASNEVPTISVGDTLAPDAIHIITVPGRYGLGPEVPGSHYAVAAGRLIRVDAQSFKVLSILRVQDGILDP